MEVRSGTVKCKSMLHHIVRSAESKVDCDSNSFTSFSSHVVWFQTRDSVIFFSNQATVDLSICQGPKRENWSLISSGNCTASSKASFMLVRTGMSIAAINKTRRGSGEEGFKKTFLSDFCWKKGAKCRSFLYSAQCEKTLHVRLCFKYGIWILKSFCCFG